MKCDRLISCAFAFLLGALSLATLELVAATHQLQEDRAWSQAQASANMALARTQPLPLAYLGSTSGGTLTFGDPSCSGSIVLLPLVADSAAPSSSTTTLEWSSR